MQSKESLIDEKLEALAKSKFRSSFKLRQKDKDYVLAKGIDTIREHAVKFVNNRWVNKLLNDGKQTPMRGHPVFIAQHATATCCRGCIEKWYRISQERALKIDEIEFIIEIIMEWIKRQISA